MSKVTTLLVLALLICGSIVCSARPSPQEDTLVKAQNKDYEIKQADQVVEENCEGVGEEECLMRRTLAAHLDYIYTQKQKQP